MGESGGIEGHEGRDFEEVELAVARLGHGVTRDFRVLKGEVLVLRLDIGRVPRGAVVAPLIVARV